MNLTKLKPQPAGTDELNIAKVVWKDLILNTWTVILSGQALLGYQKTIKEDGVITEKEQEELDKIFNMFSNS